MAASPELRRPSSPAEPKDVSFFGTPPPEDHGSTTTRASIPAEMGEGRAGVGYRTPTSKGSKIPPTTSCPPAPRKNRRMGASTTRKRRLSELELFLVGPELMGLLFRPLDARPPSASIPPAPPRAAKRCRDCSPDDYE